MKTCVRCGTELEQDPIHAHWQHCPRCSPVWTQFGRNYRRLMRLDQFASFAASDPRGRPTIGGAKEK